MCQYWMKWIPFVSIYSSALLEKYLHYIFLGFVSASSLSHPAEVPQRGLAVVWVNVNCPDVPFEGSTIKSLNPSKGRKLEKNNETKKHNMFHNVWQGNICLFVSLLYRVLLAEYQGKNRNMKSGVATFLIIPTGHLRSILIHMLA